MTFVFMYIYYKKFTNRTFTNYPGIITMVPKVSNAFIHIRPPQILVY